MIKSALNVSAAPSLIIINLTEIIRPVNTQAWIFWDQTNKGEMTYTVVPKAAERNNTLLRHSERNAMKRRV